jgi:lipoprotein NlpI
MRMLLLGATALATSPFPLALAQDEATGTKVADLAHSGDFAGAAALMQTLVEAQPLDRSRRLILGQLWFGGGDFAAAADEFQRIEKRGGTKDDFAVLNIGEALAVGSPDKAALLAGSRFQDSAAWLYLALRRKGDTQASVPGGPRESIRNLLRGEASKAEYVDLQWQIIDALLDGVAKRYGSAAGVTDAVKVAKKNLRAELTCVAEFALGEQALGNGDRDEAAKRFRAALDTKAQRIVELHISRAELARIG